MKPKTKGLLLAFGNFINRKSNYIPINSDSIEPLLDEFITERDKVRNQNKSIPVKIEKVGESFNITIESHDYIKHFKENHLHKFEDLQNDNINL